MRLKIVIIIVLIPFISCKHSSKNNLKCDYEKAFISIDYLNKIHPEFKDFDKEYNSKNLQVINYYNFNSLSQVDSAIFSFIGNFTGSLSIIPLKYFYNSDTLLLPAFYIGYGENFVKNVMTISVNNSETIFTYKELSIKLNDPSLKDSLTEIISSKFDPFFEKLFDLKENVNDTNLIKKKFMSEKIRQGWRFRFELQDNNQWRNIDKSLNVVLTMYLSGLKKSMKKCYKKEICELDSFELRLISFMLFIKFEFNLFRPDMHSC